MCNCMVGLKGLTLDRFVWAAFHWRCRLLALRGHLVVGSGEVIFVVLSSSHVVCLIFFSIRILAGTGREKCLQVIDCRLKLWNTFLHFRTDIFTGWCQFVIDRALSTN